MVFKQQTNKNRGKCYLIVYSDKLATLNGNNIETKK